MTSSFRTSPGKEPQGTNFAALVQKAQSGLSEQAAGRERIAKLDADTRRRNALQKVKDADISFYKGVESLLGGMSNITQQQYKIKKQDEIAEAKLWALENASNLDVDQLGYLRQIGALQSQQDLRSLIATDESLKGADPVAISRFRDFNNYQQHAAMEILVSDTFKGLEGWLQEKYTDKETKYALPSGKRLTPFEASSADPTDAKAMTALLKKEWMKEKGLLIVSNDILQSNAEVSQKATARIDKTHENAWLINSSAKRRELNRGQLRIHKDPNIWLRNEIGERDDEGNVITRAKALDMLERQLIDDLKSGKISLEDIKEMEGTPISDELGGKRAAAAEGKDPNEVNKNQETWGQKHPQRFLRVRQMQAKEENAAFTLSEQTRKRESLQMQQQMIAALPENPTAADYEALRKEYYRNPKFRDLAPKLLESDEAINSVSAKAKVKMKAILEDLKANGRLTSQALSVFPVDLQRDYAAEAKLGDQREAALATHIPELDAYLRDAVKTSTAGGTNYTALAMKRKVLQNMRESYRRYLPANSSSKAAELAFTEAIQALESGKDVRGGQYERGPEGFKNVLPNAKAVTEAKAAAAVDLPVLAKNIREQRPLRSKDVLEARSKRLIQSGQWSPDSHYEYKAMIRGTNALFEENEDRKKYGLSPLGAPPGLKAIENKVSPSVQRYLNRYKTEAAKATAGAQIGFDKALIPNNMGDVIEQAAQVHNIKPAQVAALAKYMNAWDKPGIESLAATFSSYMGQNGGSVNAAVKSMFGDSDNVLNQFTRFSLQYGDTQALRNEALMRPSMRSKYVSSITFDRNQPGIDVYFEDKNFTSVLPGKVKEVGNQLNADGSGYGNFVVVESIDPATGNKVDVLYSHLSSIDVSEGQEITDATRIGTQGGTGSVQSVDGTIASIDFLAPGPKGSKSMTPYTGYESLRNRIARQLKTR